MNPMVGIGVGIARKYNESGRDLWEGLKSTYTDGNGEYYLEVPESRKGLLEYELKIIIPDSFWGVKFNESNYVSYNDSYYRIRIDEEKIKESSVIKHDLVCYEAINVPFVFINSSPVNSQDRIYNFKMYEGYNDLHFSICKEVDYTGVTATNTYYGRLPIDGIAVYTYDVVKNGIIRSFKDSVFVTYGVTDTIRY